MEHIKCIFCDIWSDQIVIEENGYKGRKCPQCDLIYVSPRPSLSQINNLYSEEKCNIYAKAIIPDDFAKRLCARHTLRIINKYIKSGSIFEIGAGAGFFLDEAKRKGFKVYGNELNNILVDFAKNNLGISCERNSFDKSSFGEKKFNIIYHCNTLSHFHDPLSEFKNIYGKLENNGILIFETGNLGDVRRKYYKTYPKFDYPDHLFFFSEKSLKRLIELTGFEVVEVYHYSQMPLFYRNTILNTIKNFKGRKEIKRNTKNNTSKYEASIDSANGFSLKKLIRRINLYLSYILTYKIGYFVPKKGKPQTIIVIARKRT